MVRKDNMDHLRQQPLGTHAAYPEVRIEAQDGALRIILANSNIFLAGFPAPCGGRETRGNFHCSRV